jgi:hypothetical protein
MLDLKQKAKIKVQSLSRPKSSDAELKKSSASGGFRNFDI